mgnify:CR=1 FL=1
MINRLTLILFFSLIVACESLDPSRYSDNHHVMTIDRSQVKSLNCVYLYDTEKRESGWNNSFATSNALRVFFLFVATLICSPIVTCDPADE